MIHKEEGNANLLYIYKLPHNFKEVPKIQEKKTSTLGITKGIKEYLLIIYKLVVVLIIVATLGA